MRKEEMTQVTPDQLLSALSGSTDFGEDELVEMFAHQDDNNKDFCIYHRQKAFCVPLHKIREYFTRHTKPIPPMTKDQELIYLREKVKKLQDQAEGFQGMDKIARPAPDVPDEPEAPEKLENPLPDDLPPGEFETAGGQDAPVVKEEVKVIPPKRDESIPPPHEREKQSLKEVRASLAEELQGAKLPKKKVTDSAKPKDILRAPKEK